LWFQISKEKRRASSHNELSTTFVKKVVQFSSEKWKVGRGKMSPCRKVNIKKDIERNGQLRPMFDEKNSSNLLF